MDQGSGGGSSQTGTADRMMIRQKRKKSRSDPGFVAKAQDWDGKD